MKNFNKLIHINLYNQKLKNVFYVYGRMINNRGLYYIKLNNFGAKNNGNGNKNNEPKQGLMQKILKYGKTGMYVYGFFYIVGFVAFYFLFSTKTLNADKVEKKLEDNEWKRTVSLIHKFKEKLGPKYTDVVYSYVCNYVLDLVRIPGVLALLSWWFRKYKK